VADAGDGVAQPDRRQVDEQLVLEACRFINVRVGLRESGLRIPGRDGRASLDVQAEDGATTIAYDCL